MASGVRTWHDGALFGAKACVLWGYYQRSNEYILIEKFEGGYRWMLHGPDGTSLGWSRRLGSLKDAKDHAIMSRGRPTPTVVPAGVVVGQRQPWSRGTRGAGKGHGGPGKSTTLFYAREDPKHTWKHLMAISDGRLVLFEMEPAIIAGWNCKRTTIQSGDDWDGMPAASIVAFKQRSGDQLLRPATMGEVEWMKSKLAASGGKRRHPARSQLCSLTASINKLVR
jgi:hypothetical protein